MIIHSESILLFFVFDLSGAPTSQVHRPSNGAQIQSHCVMFLLQKLECEVNSKWPKAPRVWKNVQCIHCGFGNDISLSKLMKCCSDTCSQYVETDKHYYAMMEPASQIGDCVRCCFVSYWLTHYVISTLTRQ
mgnify:CR=1 FL=1